MSSSASYAASRRGTKRRRTASTLSRYTQRRAIPRAISSSGGNGCIIPVIVDYDFNLTVDLAKGFAFDCTNMYASGGVNAIPGVTEIHAVFGMMRVHKVEMTILPSANSLDYNNQTLGSGVTNIPFVYHAIDYQDGNTPTLAEIRTNPTCKVDSLSKVIKRTFYPRLEGSNGVIDISNVSRRNLFQESNTISTQKYHGIKLYVDMNTVVWTYGSLRVSFKIFYEVRQSK